MGWGLISGEGGICSSCNSMLYLEQVWWSRASGRLSVIATSCAAAVCHVCRNEWYAELILKAVPG
jgi:hypothetical protein